MKVKKKKKNLFVKYSLAPIMPFDQEKDPVYFTAPRAHVRWKLLEFGS